MLHGAKRQTLGTVPADPVLNPHLLLSILHKRPAFDRLRDLARHNVSFRSGAFEKRLARKRFRIVLQAPERQLDERRQQRSSLLGDAVDELILELFVAALRENARSLEPVEPIGQDVRRDALLRRDLRGFS